MPAIGQKRTSAPLANSLRRARSHGVRLRSRRWGSVKAHLGALKRPGEIDLEYLGYDRARPDYKRIKSGKPYQTGFPRVCNCR